MTTPGDRALLDLKQVLEGALQTNGALLAAGERVLVQRMLALHGDAGRLYVRLLGRKGSVFRLEKLDYDDVGDLVAACRRLEQLDLAHQNVSWGQRLPLYTMVELKEVCRQLGLKRSGKREALEQRLKDRTHWADDPVLRICGAPVVRKLEILWFRSGWRDRTALLLERIGQTRFADYERTEGGRAFADRSEFGRYLSALWGGEQSPEALLAEVQAHPPRPAVLRGLDPRRIWANRATEAARELERAGERQRSIALYEGLLEAGVSQPGLLAKRLALCLEGEGEPARGARVCVDWMPHARVENRPSLTRTGRRLSRKAKLPWRPPVPLRKPPERTLTLPFAEGRWSDGHRIEWAVIHHLAPRPALHGENTLWTTLFGLVFLDLYWLPIAGMLPAPYLSGPLDLGTPAFLENRLEALSARMEADLEPIVRANYVAYEGCIARGVWWELDLDVLAGVANAGKPILWRLLREGWGASRGLPDLAVLGGPAQRVRDLFPSRLPQELLLVEVKGPHDQVRDEQAVWHDYLLSQGVPLEIWRIKAAVK